MARLSDSVAPLVKMISLGGGADQIGNLLARFIHGLLGDPAELVIAAGGVAEVLREIGQHRVEDPRVHLRRRVIIEINGRLHFVLQFLLMT